MPRRHVKLDVQLHLDALLTNAPVGTRSDNAPVPLHQAGGLSIELIVLCRQIGDSSGRDRVSWKTTCLGFGQPGHAECEHPATQLELAPR